MNCPNCTSPLQKNHSLCPSCGAPNPTMIATDPLVGRVLEGQYRLERKLGVGAFGAVYEGYDLELSRKVAIKTLHRHLAFEFEAVARFHRESRATSLLTHPCVVKIYHRGRTEDGILWIAMEYLEGETLAQRLQTKGPLQVAEFLEVFGPLCEALSEAHEKGIIHRDLKPENIMLVSLPGQKLLPRLLDFGIATLLEGEHSVTRTGTVSGTPMYMAPEQWKGLKEADHRSDLYSLGLIAYRALSGRLPFEEAKSVPAWMSRHCFEAPLPLEQAMAPREAPPHLVRAVMRTLEKSPEARPQSALEWKRALEGKEELPPLPSDNVLPAVQDTLPLGTSVATEEQNTLPSKKKPAPSQAGWLLALLLAMGTTALGLWALYWFVKPEPPPERAAPASQEIKAEVLLTERVEPATKPQKESIFPGCKTPKLTLDPLVKEVGVNLRSAPLLRASTLIREIPNCTPVCQKGIEGEWAQVVLRSGERGYIHLTRLALPDAPRCKEKKISP